MEYKKINNKIIARIDANEEILEQLEIIALKEDIKLASISALGAVDKFKVGVFKVSEKKYYANEFDGDYEIVSLTGTISQMDNKYYPHLHISCGDDKGLVVGGHLNYARVSATCEIIIDIISGVVDRTHDENIGLNLFDFNK